MKDDSRPWANDRHYPLLRYALILALAIALIWVASGVLLDGIDWSRTYRPAAQALLSLKSPYGLEASSEAPFVAAPWGLIPLLPLALFPVRVGRALLLLISLGAFAYTTKKLGASMAATVIFLISPPVVHCLLNGNIEWIPILGFVLPPQIGLFFVSVKPQTGIAVAIFWFFQAWQEGGFRLVVKTFLPVSLALAASFALFGLWPLHAGQAYAIAQDFNASFWPASIPVGLALLAVAVRRKQVKWAMPASPCFSPYVLFHTWSGALASLVGHTRALAGVTAALWLLIILRLF